MSSLATAGVGAKLKKWSGGEWIEISEIKNINGPGMSKATIDVTSLSSTGGYREFIGGFKDGGSISMTMLFRRDTYEIMKADFEDSDLQNYEIILPDTEETTIEFEGLVTELGLAIPTDDAITSDVSIKISGEPVMNSGSGSAS